QTSLFATEAQRPAAYKDAARSLSLPSQRSSLTFSFALPRLPPLNFVSISRGICDKRPIQLLQSPSIAPFRARSSPPHPPTQHSDQAFSASRCPRPASA